MSRLVGLGLRIGPTAGERSGSMLYVLFCLSCLRTIKFVLATSLSRHWNIVTILVLDRGKFVYMQLCTRVQLCLAR